MFWLCTAGLNTPGGPHAPACGGCKPAAGRDETSKEGGLGRGSHRTWIRQMKAQVRDGCRERRTSNDSTSSKAHCGEDWDGEEKHVDDTEVVSLESATAGLQQFHIGINLQRR